MESGRNDNEPGDGDGASREGARALFHRLLHKLSRPALPADEKVPPQDSLLPPGQRSGRGTRSLEPYLDQYRNSRPGALE